MTELSIPKVTKVAPAAAPPRNDRETLLDTTQFLKHCATSYGMNPVVAVQGTAHRDAETVDAKSGRHLVAATNARGYGYVLLNSHFKDRRAHIGMCYVRPGTTTILIVDSTPVQRWRGFVPVLESFEPKWSEAKTVLNALDGWSPSAATMRELAAKMAKQGYLANATLHPEPESLFDNFDGSALGFAFHMLDKMLKGRLPSTTPGTRRVRAIRRPDTLFHAGMTAFDLVKERARSLGKVSARCSFVVTPERLVRP